MVDGINGAFDRIDAFLAVQSGAPFPQFLDAVNRLQSAVGITNEERVTIRARLEALDQLDHTGGVLLGLIIGLFATNSG